MKKWFSVRNSADTAQPVEILIYEQIGANWWSEDGIAAKDFAEMLSGIPRGQKINLRVNSQGGNVWDGLAIYRMIKDRGADVTGYNDGIALSIASVILLACGKVICPANCLWMIHDPSSTCEGTADDMRRMADMLEKHIDALASTYALETNLSDAEARAMMKATTWLTGQEAYGLGFCDQITEEIQIAASFDRSKFRNVPQALLSISETTDTTTTPQNTPKNMKKNILLNPQATDTTGGGGTAPTPTAPAAAAPAQPRAAGNIVAITAEQFAEVNNRLADITAKFERERRGVVEKSVDNQILTGRVLAAQREFWIKSILADDGAEAVMNALPISTPQNDPVPPQLTITNESLVDIGNHMTRLREPQASYTKGNMVDHKALLASAKASANFHWDNRGKMMQILNANTIDSNLKRNVVLNEMVRAFAINLIPLSRLCTVFNGVRLEGTDIVAVPYLPLTATASTDFNQANGYVMGDSAQNAKPVTLNKRKYQPIRFNSSELNRQPALNLVEIEVIKAEKLATDIFNDVLSVITAAAYGSSTIIGAAAAFDGADIVDMQTVADTAEWPKSGRILVTKSAYLNNMLKAGLITASYLSVANYGSVSPAQDGVVSRFANFDIFQTEQIPGNGENLIGFIAWKSGILAATSPINPSEEVRKNLSRYELVVHPFLGIGFEYRLWGNADADERREVIECNYGYAAGEAAAVKRMTSA